MTGANTGYQRRGERPSSLRPPPAVWSNRARKDTAVKYLLLAVALCLALTGCRTLRSSGPPAGPSPTQGTAAVQATISDPAR